MNAQASSRGWELVAGGEILDAVPRWLTRVWAGGIDRLLDIADRGIARGSILAKLPDGTTRQLGGHSPGFSAVVELRSYQALLRLATGGSVGWYHAWDAGEWDSPDPVALFAVFMDNRAGLGPVAQVRGPWRLLGRLAHWRHRNTRSGSLRNIHAHYDLGNDFYATWLDSSMSYSSARFAGKDRSLEAGQMRKIASIARRVEGARTLLEIGCGWGSLARHFADRGTRVTAISLSDEQLAWAAERHGGAGIEFRKQDYRDVQGQFDAIASVEMVEAVGQQFWPDFFDCIARCLKPGGRAAIQYISMREDLFHRYVGSVDFIQAHVFPGGMLVCESTFRRLAEKRGLEWRDGEAFGLDYAETLRLWRKRFDKVVKQGGLPPGFDARFVRLWRYYLMYCEGGFRGGGIDVAQVTLVKRG
jgi:cyclopropane-fatty-acyl-phospholipid synthase